MRKYKIYGGLRSEAPIFHGIYELNNTKEALKVAFYVAETEYFKKSLIDQNLQTYRDIAYKYPTKNPSIILKTYREEIVCPNIHYHCEPIRE